MRISGVRSGHTQSVQSRELSRSEDAVGCSHNPVKDHCFDPEHRNKQKKSQEKPNKQIDDEKSETKIQTRLKGKCHNTLLPT